MANILECPSVSDPALQASQLAALHLRTALRQLDELGATVASAYVEMALDDLKRERAKPRDWAGMPEH